jgi:hypothetical protein
MSGKAHTLEAAPGHFVLVDDGDNTRFEDANGNIRVWRKESGAISWIRGTVNRYNQRYQGEMMFEVTKTDGSVVTIGRGKLDPERFGPHDWEKQNGATILDGSTSYDLMRCRLCGETVKRFGLSQVSGGTCPKNEFSR